MIETLIIGAVLLIVAVVFASIAFFVGWASGRDAGRIEAYEQCYGIDDSGGEYRNG